MAMADAGTMEGGRSAGVSGAGGGGAGGHHRPTCFPNMRSHSRTSGPRIQRRFGRNTSCRRCCPWPGRAWVNSGYRTLSWQAASGGRANNRRKGSKTAAAAPASLHLFLEILLH
jgi:hypothetical protein